MKKKSIISLLIAGMMLFGLAACTGTDNNPPPSGSQSPSGSSPSPSASPAASPGASDSAPLEQTPDDEYNETDFSKFPARDLGGRVIRFMDHFENWRFPDSSISEPQPGDDDYLGSLARYQNMKRIEAKYNVKFERFVVPVGEKVDILTTSVMSGDPICDMVGFDNNQIVRPVVNGDLLPVKDYIPATSDARTGNRWMRICSPLFGEQYFFTGVDRDFDGTEIDVDGAFLGFNRDLLNSVGAEDPMELYKQGNWTYEKFAEICALVTKDLDDDGAPDQWGLSGWIAHIAAGFVAANDGQLVDDSCQQKFDSPKTMRALEFLERLFVHDKVVYLPDGNLWSWGGNTNAFKEGNIAFFAVYAWMLPRGENRVPWSLGAVPFPKGPDNNSNYSYFREVVTVGRAIPKGVKDPEIVFQIYEEFMTPYYTADTADLKYERNGTFDWMASFLSTEADIEMVAYLSVNTGKPDMFDVFGDFPLDVFDPIARGYQTPAQAVEENKQLMQEFLDGETAKQD